MSTDLMILESNVPAGSSYREHADRIAAYLPLNYGVIPPTAKEFADDPTVVRIAGVDRAGWTAHEYVIPRLASGLVFCRVAIVVPITRELSILLAPEAVA